MVMKDVDSINHSILSMKIQLKVESHKLISIIHSMKVTERTTRFLLTISITARQVIRR